MKHALVTLLLGLGVLSSAPAFAQEAPAAPGRVEVTIIPIAERRWGPAPSRGARAARSPAG
jgi:hypothetical protein